MADFRPCVSGNASLATRVRDSEARDVTLIVTRVVDEVVGEVWCSRCLYLSRPLTYAAFQSLDGPAPLYQPEAAGISCAPARGHREYLGVEWPTRLLHRLHTRTARSINFVQFDLNAEAFNALLFVWFVACCAKQRATQYAFSIPKLLSLVLDARLSRQLLSRAL